MRPEHHSELFVCDVHHDYSLHIMSQLRTGQSDVLAEYKRLMDLGGVDLECYTVGGDHPHFCGSADLFEGTLETLDKTLEIVNNSSDFQVVLAGDSLAEVQRSGRKALLFTIEGLAPIGESLTRLHVLYRLGLRSAMLTWFKANPVGDGVGEERNGGLTRFGVKCVKEMEALGIIIDVSQSSERTFWDVLGIATTPIIASHSNAYSVCPHPRNLKDEQIRAIADSGGMVCVHTFPKHVDLQTPSLERMIDHIDHIAGLVGDDHVGIGLNLTVNAEDAKKMFNEALISYDELWIDGISTLDQMPNITRKLLDRGYSMESIAKIMGGNFCRVIRSVM